MGRSRLFRAALKARAPGFEPRPSLVRLMRTGEGSLADEADAFVLACSAPRRGTGVGKLSGLSEGEAAKIAVAGVDRWVHLGGTRRALEIISLLGSWRPVPFFSDEHARLLAVIRLREWLAHAPDHAYADALAFAASLDARPRWRSEAIAYLFPDHRPFFARAAEELRAHGEKSTLLLGAITTSADHALIADHVGTADLDRNALVISTQLSEDGLAVLLVHARDAVRQLARTVHHVPGIVRALSLYASPAAARALAEFADHRAARPAIEAYFAAHPELRPATGTWR